MNFSTHFKRPIFRNQLAILFFCLLLLPAWQSLYAQACTTPPTSLVNGNFDVPATAIGPGNTGINDDLAGWFVAHGDPTTASTAPRSMWMWSYMHSSGTQYGEGVFNCYDFQAGQSYLICFDLQTNGKADGATVNVRATSAFSPDYSGSWVFPLGTPNELIWQDLVANYTYANWTQISVVYTPTVNNTQIWFHPFWAGMPPGTPAPEGNPSQSEMRIDNVSITPLAGQNCPCDLTADYTYDASNGCEVQFNDATASNCCTDVVGYKWDFGDGTTATGANPLHTFPGSGTYNVCLVTVGLNALGDCCTDSICYDVTVDCDTCSCEVFPDFRYTPDNCTVTFGDLSTSSSCTQITGWEWNFGDGNTSTLQNPIHTYTGSGIYSVCLRVFGTTGTEDCEDVICYDVEVDCDTCNCEVFPDFNYTADNCKVTFDDLSTSNSCTQITGWEWDFGDGNTSTLQNPMHTYSSSGIYSVCLRVFGTTGTEDCEDVICYDVEVNCDGEPCPCKVFTHDFGYNINRCRVDFFGFGDADCPIIGWEWDFGDGGISNLQNPTHIYGSNGVYNVCFTIIMQAPDGTECRETLCLLVHITDCGDADNPSFKTAPDMGGTQSNLPFEPKVYPNPSSGKIHVAFETKTAMNIEISVYDASMQRVANLLDGTQEAGLHTIEWESDKTEIASGTYYIMIKQDHVVSMEKVIINR